MPIVLQEERIEDNCYHDQQTPQQEATFFISAISPLSESEIDLLLNISSQVNSFEFDEDLQEPCQSLCSQDYNDCQLSGFSDLSSPQSLFQKDNIQEVDQLVEKKVFLHFPSLITIKNILIHLHMMNMMMIILSSQFLILHQKVSFFRKIMMLFSLHGLIAI